MTKERLIGSYLVRFSQKHKERFISLQNMHTGEQLEFETWTSAWAFLESVLEEDKSYFPSLNPRT